MVVFREVLGLDFVGFAYGWADSAVGGLWGSLRLGALRFRDLGLQIFARPFYFAPSRHPPAILIQPHCYKKLQRAVKGSPARAPKTLSWSLGFKGFGLMGL